MSFDGLRLSPIPLLGAVPAWHARVESGRLPEVCESARAQGGDRKSTRLNSSHT